MTPEQDEILNSRKEEQREARVLDEFDRGMAEEGQRGARNTEAERPLALVMLRGRSQDEELRCHGQRDDPEMHALAAEEAQACPDEEAAEDAQARGTDSALDQGQEYRPELQRKARRGVSVDDSSVHGVHSCAWAVPSTGHSPSPWMCP